MKRKKMVFVGWLCAGLMVAVGEAAGQDYYIATIGSDTNPGTFAEPFVTIQHAVDLSAPGSTLYIRGGTYREAIDLAGVAGSEANPIVLMAYEGEEVFLDGTTEITTTWTLDEGAIYKTTIPEDVTQLFVDGELMTLARFPNALAFSDAVFTPAETRRTRAAGASNGAFDDGGGAGISVVDSGISFDGCIGVLNFATFITDSRVMSHVAGTSGFTYDPLVSYKSSSSYFLEGGVGGAERKMLDMAQEWAYDEVNKELWLWADNGQNPNGRSISGKTKTFLVTGDAATQHVILDGINFFAGTFSFESSDSITIQNCDFDYFTASTRAVGDITRSATSRMVGTDTDPCEDMTIYNCNFRYADGRVLYGSYTENLVIENNLLYKIDYACSADLRYTEPGSDPGSATALNLVDTYNLTYRRNTIDTAGGAQIISVHGWPSLFEYNYHTKCGALQEDGSSIYMYAESITDSIIRHNWFYANYKRDARYDGNNSPLVGVGGILYRNVSVSTSTRKDVGGSAYRLKGDLHETYNNVGLGDESVINIALDKGGNARSITYNNAANEISDDPIPGTASHNFIGQHETRSMESLLRDSDNFDFRPREDAVDLIDQGREVFVTRFDDTEDEESISVTDGYLGLAPDLGAYEYGDSSYWIPGQQTAQASWAIPQNDGLDVRHDTDLMYLIGLDGVSANILFGTDSNSLSFLTHKVDPENIVILSNHFTLDANSTYYWRVDTLLADSSVVTGEVWNFTTDPDDGLIQAEDYTSMSGIQTETTADTDGGENIGDISDGDWCMYADVDLTDITSVNVRTASRSSGNAIEIRLGSTNGTLIGTVSVSDTRGWQTWTTDSASILSTSGTHDVYLVFTTGGGFNVNWFEFIGGGAVSDTTPPTPNIATFAIAPAAEGSSAIRMTATTGSDDSGLVEYSFNEVSGHSGGTSSGWQSSASYTDSGLSATTEYTYTVTLRDRYSNTGSASSPVSATTDADTTAPTPNAATFAIAPTADSSSAISMTATTGSDDSGSVEYYFAETSGHSGGTDSGWQTSTSYTDSGLSASTEYTYTVTLRDRFGNAGSASSAASVTTTSGVGDPISLFIEAEDYTSMSGIQTETTADTDGGENIGYIGDGDWCRYANVDLTDITSVNVRTASKSSGNAIEVRLGSTSGTLIGTISVSDTGGWQSWTTDQASITRTDGIHDVYLVFTTGGGFNVNWFEFTGTITDTMPPTPNAATFAVAPVADSTSAISMTATTGFDDSGPVEYYFAETSGHPGGTDSGWQTGTSYTDSGLSASTEYTYTVTLRDRLSNTGNASSAASATTQHHVAPESGIETDGTEVVLSWMTVSGETYGVMGTTNLTTESWIDITNGISGNDARMSVTNAITEKQQFFQVYREE